MTFISFMLKDFRCGVDFLSLLRIYQELFEHIFKENIYKYNQKDWSVSHHINIDANDFGHRFVYGL